ncbi:MAG: DUF309 domain-containing protein [Bdellovibrionota bacterium]
MAVEEGFDRGCELFDAGEYFEAHEVWEDLWAEAMGARHAFLQGLIQTAVALHHAGNENWKGTRSLLASSLKYLEKGEKDSHPVDVPALRDRILDFEIALQKKLAGEGVELPFFPVPLLLR